MHVKGELLCRGLLFAACCFLLFCLAYKVSFALVISQLHRLLVVNMQIKDRTFIITGGSSGLGLATGEDLHSQGGYIAILDLNQDAGEEAVKQFGSRAKFFECDVTSTENIESAVKGAVDWVKSTGKPIGAIISGAGVGNPGKVCHGIKTVRLFFFLTQLDARSPQ